MSTRNRERRKANKKAREQERLRREARDRRFDEPVASLPQLIEEAAIAAAAALYHGDTVGADQCVRWLASPAAAPAALVDAGLLTCLCRTVALVWPRGWQPQDLVRMVERQYGARHGRLAGDVVLAELRRYAPATVDERWDAQVAALGSVPWWDRDDEFLSRWGEREKLDRTDTILHAVEVLHIAGSLPELPQLCPPPGAARRGSLAGAAGPGSSAGAAGRDADQRMLARVRALLAKAESTDFPEEADAFTAKAQELMARHSIDYALLAAAQGRRERPEGIRVGIDAPYESSKSMLLAQVAGANRCTAVWSTGLGFSTVLGFPADLESVEMLYTSLLVQATAAMMREGARRDSYGRTRTRSFRQSFLNAYAVRIGERLRGATEQASDEAVRREGEDRLLPVLAARDEAVTETARAMFPETTSRQVSVTNVEGWASGTAAADLASLHTRGQVGEAGAR